MLDPKALRSDINLIAAQLATRGFHLDVAHFMQHEQQRKTLQVESELIKNERNVKSKKRSAKCARKNG